LVSDERGQFDPLWTYTAGDVAAQQDIKKSLCCHKSGII
jgi:hypothetical protein